MSSTPSSPNRPSDSSFTNQTAEDEIEVDVVLQSLAHPRRREILGLLDGEPIRTRADLAECLQDGQAQHGVPSKDSIEESLVHEHLPMLEAADLVSLEADSWVVRQGKSYDIVREMADAAAAVVAEKYAIFFGSSTGLSIHSGTSE